MHKSPPPQCIEGQNPSKNMLSLCREIVIPVIYFYNFTKDTIAAIIGVTNHGDIEVVKIILIVCNQGMAELIVLTFVNIHITKFTEAVCQVVIFKKFSTDDGFFH